MSKCANPACGIAFHDLRHGRLFLIDRGPRLPWADTDFHERPHACEYLWLCAQCTLTLTVGVNQQGNPILVLKSEPEAMHDVK